MSSVKDAIPDRQEWRIHHITMIAFPIDAQLGLDQNWWKDLTGSQPESSTKKPQKREDSGPFEDVTLSLDIDPFRVSWTISPLVDLHNLPVNFPTLGGVFSRRDWLVSLMSRWLDVSPPIKRLAFAGSLLQFVPTKEQSYRRLNSYLHGVDVDPDTSDFMYRLNRQRESRTGVPGLRVNRLCTWTAAKLKFGLQAVSKGTREIRDVPLCEEQYACAIELDINTAPDFPMSELPRDSLRDIFSELVDIGLQAAERGDCK
jgi:hypothetical protein